MTAQTRVISERTMSNLGISNKPDGANPMISSRLVCRLASAVVHSRWFDTFIGAFVIANAVCIGVESELSLAGNVPRWLLSMDVGFLCIYVVELMLRILADGLRVCTQGAFWFDVGLVVLGLAAQAAQLFTLRESPPSHPKTATFAKCTGYRELSVCAVCLSTGG